MNNDLTLLIPAKFESESLPIFLEELKNYNYKKLVVLDQTDTKTINSIKINDQISKKVREQYEKNPYPRWKNINKIFPTSFLSDLNNDIRPNQVFLDKKSTMIFISSVATFPILLLASTTPDHSIWSCLVFTYLLFYVILKKTSIIEFVY